MAPYFGRTAINITFLKAKHSIMMNPFFNPKFFVAHFFVFNLLRGPKARAACTLTFYSFNYNLSSCERRRRELCLIVTPQTVSPQTSPLKPSPQTLTFQTATPVCRVTPETVIPQTTKPSSPKLRHPANRHPLVALTS